MRLTLKEWSNLITSWWNSLSSQLNAWFTFFYHWRARDRSTRCAPASLRRITMALSAKGRGQLMPKRERRLCWAYVDFADTYNLVFASWWFTTCYDAISNLQIDIDNKTVPYKATDSQHQPVMMSEASSHWWSNASNTFICHKLNHENFARKEKSVESNEELNPKSSLWKPRNQNLSVSDSSTEIRRFGLIQVSVGVGLAYLKCSCSSNLDDGIYRMLTNRKLRNKVFPVRQQHLKMFGLMFCRCFLQLCWMVSVSTLERVFSFVIHCSRLVIVSVHSTTKPL